MNRRHKKTSSQEEGVFLQPHLPGIRTTRRI